MYLPRGNWYNFWTNEKMKGGKELWTDAGIDTMPIFIKEGAIIPKYPVQQYVGEKKIEEITLDVYYKEGKEDSQLFEDLQDGYGYVTGDYRLRTFKLIGRKNQLIIQQHIEGNFKGDTKKFKLRIHGLPFQVDTVQLDNQIQDKANLFESDSQTITIDENFTEIDLISNQN